MDLHEFYDRVNQIIFNHLISEDGAIVDEGENNIKMENYGNVRYNYINSNDFGERNLAEPTIGAREKVVEPSRGGELRTGNSTEGRGEVGRSAESSPARTDPRSARRAATSDASA